MEKAHNEFQKLEQSANTTTTDIKIEEKPCSSQVKLEQQDEEIYERDLMQIETEIDEIENPLEGHHNDESENEGDETSDEYEPSEDMSDDNEDEESLNEELANDIKLEQNIENKTTIKKTTKRKSTAKQTDKNKNASSKKKRIFNRSDPQLSEEMIKKHIPMGCNLCVFVGQTFSDIVEHFRATHPNVRPFIMCCDKKLTKRFYVAQHALKHENPNCFR